MTLPARSGFAEQRRDELLRELRAHGAIQVTEMSKRLGVSEVTLRRDVNALVDLGIADRVHGGAILRDMPARGASPRANAPRFTVGMVVPSTNYYWPTVFADARTMADEMGVRLVVRASTYDIADHQKQIAQLIAQGVEALIVAPATDAPEADRLLHWLDQLEIPVVLAERVPVDPREFGTLEWAASDHAAGARLAVSHLISLGHTRIGLFDLGASNPTVPQLRRGWSDELARHGINPRVQLLGSSRPFATEDRDAAIDEALRQCVETRTTALVILPDPYAVFFAQRAVEQGVRIPDDLAIVAYDDEVAHAADPPLTAVRPPKRHVGRLAVELAVAQLAEGVRRPPHRVHVGAHLVVRASTAGVPSGDGR
jgi:DNA-binding LacI/PurR family transcriptional regulator